MPRYVIRADKPLYVETPLWDDQRTGLTPHLEVDDNEAVETGLLTESGDMIMRLPNPIGFGRNDEW